MKTKAILTGLALLGALVIFTAPASAQVRANTSEFHVYAGELFGDRLTGQLISGGKPELDDDIVYGVRYGYNFSDSWGIELSAGRSPSSAKNVPGGDINLDVTTFDVDAVWHLTHENRAVPYLLAGAGYATASLDHPIRGTSAGELVSIDDDASFSLNAGVGVKYFATDSFIVRAEARYRFLDALVDPPAHSLNTVETTVGVGWRF